MVDKKAYAFQAFSGLFVIFFSKKKHQKIMDGKEIDPISSSASVRSNPQSIQQGCQMITWTLQGVPNGWEGVPFFATP